MVNRLLTISIKVNIPASAESNLSRGDNNEKADSWFLELVVGRWLGLRRIQRLSPKPPDHIGCKFNALESARRSAGAFVLGFGAGLVGAAQMR
jgi:hypothetical protein